MPSRSALALAALTPILTACHAQPAPAQPPAPPAAQAPEAAPLRTHPVAFPQYPSLSPDGTVIVFSYAGDLWSVPASGGVAGRLTAHPSDENRSAFSPDGKSLAFESERDGPANIYIMPIAPAAAGQGGALVGGTPHRVTIFDKAQALSGFSADGRSVYFSAALEPSIYRMSHMYSAPVGGPDGGGAPITRLSDAFGAAPHAAGDGILFNRERYDPTRTKYVGPSNSDIYRLDLKSGAFTRLTFDAHSDGDAFALPDGSVVYVSSRKEGGGENNLFRLKPGATDKADPQQLTSFAVSGGGSGLNQTTIMHGIRDLNISGWTAVFCVWDTIYTLDLKAAGAQPKALSITAGGDFSALDFQRIAAGRQVSETALSPDGKSLAVIARGEVFVRSTEKDRPTRFVTATGKPSPWGRCRDLAWSPDGRVLYFSSDPTGISGIYAATVSLAREDLAKEEKPKAEPAKPDAPKPDAKEDAKDAKPEGEQPEQPKPDAKPDAKPDPKDDKKPASKKPDWGKRWAESINFKVAPVLISDKEQRKPQPSPDGKHLLITRDLGDLVLFDLPSDDPAKPIEASARIVVPCWNDPDARWTADSRHLIYGVEDVWFNSDIWIVDALAEKGSDAAKPVNITRHPDFDHAPRLSEDGKVLYFLSDRDADSNGEDDVYAVNLDKKLDGLRPYDLADYFTDAAAAVKKRHPASPPSSGAGSGARLGGTGGARGTRRGGGTPGTPAAPAASAAPEDKPSEPPADDKKPDDTKPEPAKVDPEHPLTFDADDAYLRTRRIGGLPRNIGQLEITPGGDRALFTASVESAPQFLSVDYSGKDRKTVFAGPASDISVSLSGDRVLFTSGGAGGGAAASPDDRPRAGGGGEPYLGKPSGGEAERMPIEAPLTIDIAAQQKQKFLDAARLMGERFFDMKGLDWPAMMARYASIITRTRTDTEFNRIFNNLLGELEGSHMGMSGGRSTTGEGQALGYLGIDVKPVPGGYQVTRIIPNGPADHPAFRGQSLLGSGAVITSINNKPLAPDANSLPATDFMAAMQGTSGQETLIEIRASQVETAPEAKNRFILVTPSSAGADTVLRYRDEAERNRKAVDKLSNGKLGYLHIRAMDAASVRDYERDLFAAADGKLGLIIDVRDNGGGSTTDILLSSLTAPRHAYTASRGVDLKTLPKDAYPRDRRLIYGYNREISVLCNQHSYSNAEIFAHAIKTIGRGKLVGIQTFGAVLSTGAYSLIDGSSMRTPFRAWFRPNGKDMENSGAMPDIIVPQTPEDEAAGKDPQLEAAVKELLTRAKEP